MGSLSSPVDLSHPGIKPGSPALQVDSLAAELPGKPCIYVYVYVYVYVYAYIFCWFSPVHSFRHPLVVLECMLFE